MCAGCHDAPEGGCHGKHGSADAVSIPVQLPFFSCMTTQSGGCAVSCDPPCCSVHHQQNKGQFALCTFCQPGALMRESDVAQLVQCGTNTIGMLWVVWCQCVLSQPHCVGNTGGAGRGTKLPYPPRSADGGGSSQLRHCSCLSGRDHHTGVQDQLQVHAHMHVLKHMLLKKAWGGAAAGSQLRASCCLPGGVVSSCPFAS